MIKQRRRSTWPATLGPDTAQDRARMISRAWRDLAIKLAAGDIPPGDTAKTAVAQMDLMCVAVGEGAWQIPSPAPAAGEWLTRDQVATLGAVRPNVVSDWVRRGLKDRRTGEERKLPSHPEGYHPDQVKDFLRWRRATRRAPTRESTS